MSEKSDALLSGEEVVISGISGRFPMSRHVDEFKDNLYQKIDMITQHPDWDNIDPIIPKRQGMIKGCENFDAGFFGMPKRQAEALDPMSRLLLECTYEAIVDAGLHPSDLEKEKTAVVVGATVTESQQELYMEGKLTPRNLAIVETTPYNYANRISYWLKTNGPSYAVDTACSSSMYAFDLAFKELHEGRCEYAIVGGSNCINNPNSTMQFALLGVLSSDGSCKSFDDSANGYVRSQGVVVFLLQRARTAKRIYAEVVYTKTNCDGYKTEGITYPSGDVQTELLNGFYKECGISPASVCFVEAHGTGTKVGDPEELASIDKIFCVNRKDPLYIGSVKSGIGHNEPASGLSAITKVLIGFETGLIPPNINYSVPRKGVEALEKGRLVVVSEKTPWPKREVLVAVNSFGFGGANGHTLLRRFNKLKVKEGQPEDDIPRLVCVSGRDSENVNEILEDLQARKLDAEFVALYHNIFRKHIEGNDERGYAIISKNGLISTSTKRNVEPESFYMVFGGVHEDATSILREFTQLPTFSDTFQRFQRYFQQRQNTYQLDLQLEKSNQDNVTHVVLANIIMQISVYETLKLLGVAPRDVFGSHLGSLTSNFIKRKLTFEEVADLSFATATLFNEAIFYKREINENEKMKFIRTSLTQVVQKVLKRRSDTFSSYLVSSLLGEVNDSSNIPADSIIVVFGSGYISRSCKETLQFDKDAEKPLVHFLDILGKLYTLGHNMDLAKIYPKVKFPVSRGTRMISSLIKLRHEKKYKTCFEIHRKTQKGIKNIIINPVNEAWSFIRGHIIDGRNLFPATGYLCLVWKMFADILQISSDLLSVVFENVKFIRAVNIPATGHINLSIVLLLDSGCFEVSDDDAVVVSGRIFKMNESEQIEENDYVFSGIKNNSSRLEEKDIYKELRLRGYNYSGVFKGLRNCTVDATQASLEWKDNWIAFLDNMLQMMILQEDTRNLYVPTGIQRLAINVAKHAEFIAEEGNLLSITNLNKIGIINSGGVQIRHLNASGIAKKKPRAEPVLETYKFIPNETHLTLKESVRVNLQLILENVPMTKVKVFEVIDEETDTEPLSTLILDTLQDLPLIQPEVVVFCNESLELENVEVQKGPIVEDGSALLAIGSGLLGRAQLVEKLLSSIKDNGFILTREKVSLSLAKYDVRKFQICTIHSSNDEKLVLLQKSQTHCKKPISIDISQSNNNFDWLALVQESLKINSHVILYSQNVSTNGILGFLNCLRKEYSNENVRCVFVDDDVAPKFDQKDHFYEKQLSKNLAVNVYKNSQWGTYRHLLLEEAEKIASKQSYLNVITPGDLSSFTWVESPYQMKSTDVEVHYSALNFRDVMIASGRIASDVFTKNWFEKMCLLGIEYAGVTAGNRRVMGMANSGALSTAIEPDRYLMWNVPDSWSLEEAATVPVVYSTSLYALIVVGKIKQGDSILIHSGTGGVGQAAINIALYYGCIIFTTVGTDEKRQFIRKQFPQIPETHIGNSRDTSFVAMISKETAGRGVDLVLNSLAEEKLQASICCLAAGGRFLEIGKFDLASNNPLLLNVFKHGKTFHGVMLDTFFKKDSHLKRSLHSLMTNCIERKMVKPLCTTVFQSDQVEQAFRHMSTGKHIGKIVIKIRDQASSHEQNLPKCSPRFYCNPDQCQVILGGLGGFGLELANWLVLRGAKKLMLTTRKGVTNGYQAFRIRTWQTHDVQVVVAKEDMTTRKGCLEVINKANALGPVENIFNLAVVLRDKSFDNQTVEDFQISFAPKAFATQHLDLITREICTHLKNFVIFSSVSCGRGNVGQTNYGMANSIMERICEQRRKLGFPGLAIQWGAVGDVGLVADMMDTANEMVIGGTLQQKITSCLDVLNVLLMQQEEPVVSSMVVAEKKLRSGEENIIGTVANILGIRNIKTVSLHAALPEMGMDSMMGVEIKQTLEREYNIFLTPQEIRTLTLTKLQEMHDVKLSLKEDEARTEQDTNILTTFIENEAKSKHSVVKLKTAYMFPDNNNPVFFLPGIEGTSLIFNTLVANLHVNAICLQYPYHKSSASIPEMALNILPHIYPYLSNEKPFSIVAHSLGCNIGLEIVHILERKGFKGKLILIDGSPEFLRKLINQNFPAESESEMHIVVLFKILSNVFSFKTFESLLGTLQQLATFEEKLDFIMEKLPLDVTHSKAYQKQLAKSIYERVLAIKNYTPSFASVASKIKLYKARDASVKNVEEDFSLSEFTKQEVEVKSFEGNHLTMLESAALANEISIELEIPSAKNVCIAVEKTDARSGELIM